MNITFIKNCPPIAASGHSAYESGEQATLKNGAALVASGYARAGWGNEVTPPDLSPDRKITASKAVRELADKHNLLLYSVVGTGKNGRILMADVEALVE